MNYYGRHKRRGTAIRIVETDEIFDTRTQCAYRLGVTVGMISMCLSGAVKTCKGYHIELIDADIIHGLDQETLEFLYEKTGVVCEWREHPYIDNLYISELGDVAKNQRGRIILTEQHEINSGYLVASVFEKNKSNSKNCNATVHRLVAETFIPNPFNKPCVNHIDGDKHNNAVYNLEWCTRSENMTHAFSNGLCPTQYVRVVETGEVYSSLAECARAIQGTVCGIHDCKSGRQRQHRGYHFEFLERDEEDD